MLRSLYCSRDDVAKKSSEDITGQKPTTEDGGYVAGTNLSVARLDIS